MSERHRHDDDQNRIKWELGENDPGVVRLMKRAIQLAEQAMERGNHPFGALLADDCGNIIFEGENAVVKEHDATRHAELSLVSNACRALPLRAYRGVKFEGDGSALDSDKESTDFESMTLVTSTTPCPMCAGAIYWAKIGRVVYGCPSERLAKASGEELSIDCRTVFEAGKLHSVKVIGPVLEEEAAAQHEAFWPRFLAAGNSL